MAELPWYDILPRMPVKSLARFRCVSKLWLHYINDSYFETMQAKQVAVEDPMLIMFHQLPSNHPNSPCKLSLLVYKVREKPPVMEFMCKSCSYRHPDDIILGYCNGLLYSSKYHHDGNTLVVIHPLRRECYELPPINRSLTHPQQTYEISVEESCGLGFDDSTNTFKMVSVVLREHVRAPDFYQVNEGLYTMVHVLGTDSWRKIHQVPSFPIIGEAVFANGCLHWLSFEENHHNQTYIGRKVISFDMTKEEFGLINPPQKRPLSCAKVQLVDLHGEVGYVHKIYCSIEVWVLKQSGWVKHCKFEPKPPLPYGFLKVLGFWNENGDVLMTDRWKQMFVYNLKSDSLYEVNFNSWEEEAAIDTRMYQTSLFSTCYSIKNDVKKR